ncbi:MAG: class I SAM-dependent methyltransferase [Bryobacteraceae bacterium]
MATINYDFSTIARNIRFITQLAWIARSLQVDRTVTTFLASHPQAAVVNLGCGLDTTFDRVDDGHVRWYDLDLPTVIDLRAKYIPDRDRSTTLPFDMFDTAWRDRIDSRRATLFLASGLFYYFEAPQVRRFVVDLAKSFPGAELLFDACSSIGLRVANRKVIKAGGMDRSALLKWSIRNGRGLEEWDRRITVVADYPVFSGLKPGFTVKERLGAALSDAVRAMSMVHVRFA